MKIRALLVATVTAGVLAVTTALPANAATYTDPLTQGDLVTFNNHTYALSIKASTDTKVTRFGHKVASTYRTRIIQSTKSGDKVLYSANLGYYRTAYLRTKLVSLNTIRDYGVATYAKKIAAFNADYAKQRVNAYVTANREKTLRADVRATAENINAYIYDHGSLTGIQNDPNVIVKSEGFFGYNEGDNLDIRISVDPGKDNIAYVIGLEKADLYQSFYDGNTGAFRSGPIDTVTNLS